MCAVLGPDTGAEVRAGARVRVRARARANANAKAQAATVMLGWDGGTSGNKQENIAWSQRLKSCTYGDRTGASYYSNFDTIGIICILSLLNAMLCKAIDALLDFL